MRELKDQFVGALLVILTVALVVAAAINLQQQDRFHLPDDGVTWVDQNGRVQALYIVSGSAGDRAGLRVGDTLISIEGHRIESSLDATQVLARLGSWSKAEYRIGRRNVEFKVNVIVGESTPDSAVYYLYVVGAIYLAIGLFVYFRRGNASKSLHFYILCLASFVLSCFHYSGKLNNFDKIIYLGNLVAGYLAPAIFLHFCLVFPEPRRWLRGRGRVAALYLPAALLIVANLGVVTGIVHLSAPLLQVRWLVDRVFLLFFSAAYLAGGVALALEYGVTDDPIIRRQLQFLRNGVVVGIVPFTVLYVLPYVFGAVPTHLMRLSILSLALMPLAWAYAILRYRLMDVDVIFQQGYVYTLATLCVIGVFYGLVFAVSKAGDVSGTALVTLIVIATFVFQPIRNWIQEQLDRYVFYRDRYDYRRTLVEFARELGSRTDLEELLSSVADRLVRTLSIQHVAFFVHDDSSGRFRLHMAAGRRGRYTDSPPDDPDLSFLDAAPAQPYLFFERTRHQLDVVSHDLPSSVRQTIAALDLTYYVPCTVRGHTIAYLGVSRNDKGDFLSSDDVELLLTLAGSVGIAVENARLYTSLQRKVEEYERLKEFSENIVESINVGILAADFEDRVESWNTQIERLTGIARVEAVGRTLRELFSVDLFERFEAVRGQTGVHNIYKFPLRPRRGGESVTLNIAIAPLVSKDSQQIGRLIIFDDVTDRAELERRLIQADKLSSIGLLAAGVAHEVNTPLAVISTYAQMLAKQVSGDDQKSKLLDKIAKQTFRASEIVNSLLNFSRTSPTDFIEVDVNRVVRETLSLIEHQLTKTRIQTTLNLEDDLPSIKGNAGKLQQVFLNLFLNARDAMPDGGLLAVRTAGEDGVLRVCVADTGAGIAPENISRIFDPFFTTKGVRKGTGLGLSVSYGIVREHGGSIEVQSELGAGARFYLEFPLSRPTSFSASTSSSGQELASSHAD